MHRRLRSYAQPPDLRRLYTATKESRRLSIMIQRNRHHRQDATHDCSTTERLANGLGWFSIGLGVAEVIAPGMVANVIGVRNNVKSRTLLRFYGLRELAAGVGILTQYRPAGWLWARVGGDAVDLWSLASAMGSSRNEKGKLTFAMVSVAGVTAADVVLRPAIERRHGTVGTELVESGSHHYRRSPGRGGVPRMARF